MRVFREEDPMDSGYTVVNNDTLWVDLSCRALGLLVRWLSKPAGVEVDTIPDIITRAKRRGNKRMEGRDALYTASYELEEEGFLVRRLFTNERGQHEWAAFVRSRPVPPEERSSPGDRKRATVKPRKAPTAARAEASAKAESPADADEPSGQETPGGASSQVSPNPGNPDSGDPVPGNPIPGKPDSENQASSYQSSLHSSLSQDAPDTSGPSRDGEREAATPMDTPASSGAVPHQRDDGGDDAARVVDAWAEAIAASGPVPNQQAAAAVRRDVDRLLADGETVDYLTAAAVDMARRNPRFRSLGKHLEHYTPVPAPGTRERCPDHPGRYRRGCAECALAVSV